MPVTESLAVFPALSWQVPFAVWPAASPVLTSDTCADSTPDSASAQSQTTVTAELFQPFPFAAGVRLAKVIVGFTESTLMSPSDAPCVLPARSAHVPDADW